jgi:hypothetical protein
MKKQQPLNYLRAVRQAFGESDQEYIQIALDWATDAPKFMLPPGGVIFDGRLRGLPDIVRLPYQAIVVEHDNPPTVIVAFEADPETEAYIFSDVEKTLSPKATQGRYLAWVSVCFVHVKSEWVCAPIICATAIDPNAQVGQRKVRLFAQPINQQVLEQFQRAPMGGQALMYLQAGPVCELVEALSCSNVSHEALPVRKPNKSAARRGALPFDEYRVLVVGQPGGRSSAAGGDMTGERRTPRQHLRRGHIRKYPSGVKVWIQCTVVNAGVGGRLHHDYDMRAA